MAISIASKPIILLICMLITITITIWSAKTLMKNERTKRPQQTVSSFTDLYKGIDTMTNLAKRYVPCGPSITEQPETHCT